MYKYRYYNNIWLCIIIRRQTLIYHCYFVEFFFCTDETIIIPSGSTYMLTYYLSFRWETPYDSRGFDDFAKCQILVNDMNHNIVTV